MAIANLSLVESSAEERVYVLETDPWSDPPFSGAPGRTWASFEATGKHLASYQWRSGIDRVREAAERVGRGEPLVAVSRALGLGGYLETVLEHRREWDEEAKDDDAILLEHLAGVRSGSVDPAAPEPPDGYYQFESDSFFDEAASALPLPPWARVEPFMGGGPGSGYEGACFVLARPHTLADLAEWLAAQEAPPARRRSTSKKVPMPFG